MQSCAEVMVGIDNIMHTVVIVIASTYFFIASSLSNGPLQTTRRAAAFEDIIDQKDAISDVPYSIAVGIELLLAWMPKAIFKHAINNIDRVGDIYRPIHVGVARR
jgi:hypothetical protein